MHHDLLKTTNTEHLHVKSMKEMACEVFNIVNNIAPTFLLKISSRIPCERTKLRLSQMAKTSKFELSLSCMMGPGSKAACQLNCEKLQITPSSAD